MPEISQSNGGREVKVLITGASKGIGRAIALRLKDTYPLILHSSHPSTLGQTLELLGGGGHSVLCADFSDQYAVTEFLKRLKSDHGKDLYGVVNNAGASINKALMFQPENDIDHMLQVNMKVPVLISKTAFKMFQQRNRGVIINMSSIVGVLGNAFQSLYAATKGALIAFSRSLAKEAGKINCDPPNRVRVLSIVPGYIETDMTAAVPEAQHAEYLAQIPLHRSGIPEDVANLVNYLLSDQATFINGSVIPITGGQY